MFVLFAMIRRASSTSSFCLRSRHEHPFIDKKLFRKELSLYV